MITLYLTPDDLAKTRFSFNHLGELFASFNVLRDTNLHIHYEPLVIEALPNTHPADFPYIQSVMLPDGYPVDFVIPKSVRQNRTFEAEIELLKSAPEEVIRADIQDLVDTYAVFTKEHEHFLSDPYEALACLVEELRSYWDQTLSTIWSQVRSVLEQDILFRARQMALYGTDWMVSNIASKIRYEAGTLQILSEQKTALTEYMLEGQGIHFVPTIFRLPCMVLCQLDRQKQSLVVYNARGSGLWQPQHLPDPALELVQLLGPARANILIMLQEPLHTSELAVKLYMTAGAVSQHLSQLRTAGIVSTYRSGHRVYYYLTPRGQGLLDLFVN